MNTVCSVIYAVCLIFDIMLLLVVILSRLFKRLISNDVPIWALVIFIAFPAGMELMNCNVGSRPRWGITLFGAFLLMYIGVIFYFLLKDIVVLGKRYIWKCSWFPLFKRYYYGDVIGYTIKLTSGRTGIQRSSRSKAIPEATIYFADNTFAEIDFFDMDGRKAVYLKETFKENKCEKNGRCRRRKRNKFFNTPNIKRSGRK